MTGDLVVDVHEVALELAELDGMTERVLLAGDWAGERQQLLERLERVQIDLHEATETLRESA